MDSIVAKEADVSYNAVVGRYVHVYCETHIHYPGGRCQWDELVNPDEPVDKDFGHHYALKYSKV